MKRLFDFCIALCALMALAPLLVLLALLVRMFLGSPILFRQERPGLAGRAFRLYKFRTMKDAVGADGEPLADELRMVGFGRWLRASSLDELPELWNVLRGDMSLVGPRPLLTEYLPLYSREQARRHEVRPGITGWSQVNGRNALSWEDRLAMDVWYVDHRSFLLDMKILWRTVGAVFLAHGISHTGHVTMPKFTGTKRDRDD